MTESHSARCHARHIRSVNRGQRPRLAIISVVLVGDSSDDARLAGVRVLAIASLGRLVVPGQHNEDPLGVTGLRGRVDTTMEIS